MFLLFVMLMGSAGFLTTRAGETVGMGTLSGFVGAMISGVATMVVEVIYIGLSGPCPHAVNHHSPEATLMFAIASGILVSTIGLALGAASGLFGGLVARAPNTLGHRRRQA